MAFCVSYESTRWCITGLDEAITDMKFPVSDPLTCVNQLCTREWQNLWADIFESS